MEEFHKWLELKKEEWRTELANTKELGTVDTGTLDVMSAMLDGIKVRKRIIKKGVLLNGYAKNIQRQK